MIARNALLFVNCFNYTLVFYCSVRCVIVPINHDDDDDDDDGGGTGKAPYSYCKSLFTNNMVDDKKQREITKKNLTNEHLHANAKLI